MKIKRIAAISVCATVLSAAELPVRTVVLYKHGVGYFSRHGTLQPGDTARLDFKTGEMNDVLKSLTITDSGGKVTGVRYDSSIPLEQKLGDLPFLIEKGQPLSAVLDQVKGARIEMEFGPQKIAGAIVSARLIPADHDHSEREQATLFLDSGELRNVDLSAASSIRFTDAKLQSQFRDYLAAVTGARSKDKRSVYIDSTQTTARDVRAEYIIPMPAWKSSYRLMFDPTGTGATLEGWAIVDNTTGEDWTSVRMSLISGKPISFISQLYAPKYIARQGAELQEDKALAPEVYNGAISVESQQRAAKMSMAAPMSQAISGAVGGFVPGQSRSQPTTIAAPAMAQELADLFEYDIARPVTVRKDESAMLPFLQQKLTARKLLIYSNTGTSNPLSAAELSNTTGKTLDGGPITVYDAGAYAGEALVETVKAGDKRFISYGLDLGTRISTTQNSHTDDVREIHVHNGLLISKSAVIQTTSYSIRNVDPRPKTLIIEYPVRLNFHLIDTAKPLETSSTVYRFEVKVPASGSVEFQVTDENVYDRQLSLSSINPDGLLAYIRNRTISDTARKQLQQIADLKTQIVKADTDRNALSSQILAATQDEERTRQNIASLSSVSGQQQAVQDYARKLSEQEAGIVRLRERQSALDQQKTALQFQLNDLMGQLDF